jgi:hypothetical protein
VHSRKASQFDDIIVCTLRRASLRILRPDTFSMTRRNIMHVLRRALVSLLKATVDGHMKRLDAARCVYDNSGVSTAGKLELLIVSHCRWARTYVSNDVLHCRWSDHLGPNERGNAYLELSLDCCVLCISMLQVASQVAIAIKSSISETLDFSELSFWMARSMAVL